MKRVYQYLTNPNMLYYKVNFSWDEFDFDLANNYMKVLGNNKGIREECWLGKPIFIKDSVDVVFEPKRTNSK